MPWSLLRCSCISFAHSKVKRFVIEIAGEQPIGDRYLMSDIVDFLTLSRWTFPLDLIDQMAPHYRRQLLKVLQELVVAFDNIPDDVKDNLTTAEEIVANTDYLIRIADVCTKHLEEEMESRKQLLKQIDTRPPMFAEVPFHYHNDLVMCWWIPGRRWFIQ